MTHFWFKKMTRFSNTFCASKKVVILALVHFFSVLDSPAYISVNRVGNFFYIEKGLFIQKIFGKFPTHFPDRYVGGQILTCSQMFAQKVTQKSSENVSKKKAKKSFFQTTKKLIKPLGKKLIKKLA
jgi:hypothetical protein